MTDAERLAQRCAQVLQLSNARLPDEYFYASVDLCVIDAVFSIGVRYEGVRNVVARYCERTGQPRLRPHAGQLSPECQATTSDLVARLDNLGPERAAGELFGNRQRTSSRNGILKAEAVRRFASVLSDHGVERLQDVPSAMADEGLERTIRAIPGQGSGLSTVYFWMLAGSDDHIKPDRMIRRFILSTIGRDVDTIEASTLMAEASALLRREDPQMNPRLLDYLMWAYQRGAGA